MRTKNTPRNPAVAVAYLRVSTDDQHLGPEAQRAQITAWAAREGVEIVAWHLDAGVSGAAPIDSRPALMAALDALATEGAGTLAVAKNDRLARDVVAAAMIERLVERSGARVMSADGVGNGGGPEAALMRAMVSAFAAYERELIRARTKAALAAKRAKGERVGAIPYGASLDADGIHLTPCGREAEIIAAACELRASGLTLRAVAAALGSRGLLARNGRPFAAMQISRMVAEAA